MSINGIYVLPTIALVVAAFAGFDAAVWALLAIGVFAGAVTLLTER